MTPQTSACPVASPVLAEFLSWRESLVRENAFACDPIDLRWHESADRLRMKMSALGIPHEHDLETSGGGHSFEYYSRMAPKALSFIAARLESERLRV